MSAIIIPRRHYTQPQGRVEVAPEWAGAMTLLVAGNLELNHVTRNFASEIVGTIGGRIQTEVHSEGFGAYFNNVSGRSGPEISSLYFPDVRYKTPPFSVFLRIRKSAFSTEAFLSFGGAGGGYGWKIGSYLASRGLNLTFGGVADYSINSTFFPATPEYINLVVVISGNQAVAYRKEGKNAVTVGNPITSARQGLSLFCAHSTATNAVDPSASSIAVASVWNRALMEVEAQSLIANPYQIFRADPVRIYSLPPVLTIPTLSSPGVIDITASSARPQVTLSY